jgi:type II secretory ATPase GspE/PulE/Tfp pilus assembly ATPase PilB-like protein
MGAKPYMIAGTFNLVMAQRLARRVCQHCKVEVNVKKENPELYNAALEAISSMRKEDLIRELKLR